MLRRIDAQEMMSFIGFSALYRLDAGFRRYDTQRRRRFAAARGHGDELRLRCLRRPRAAYLTMPMRDGQPKYRMSKKRATYFVPVLCG